MGFENASGVVPNEGSLYLFTKFNLKSPKVILTPVNISNGISWNKANDKMYYIDTPTRQIHQFDFNNTDGLISNKKIVFDLANYSNITGYPDGMTIDKDDKLWIALYNGGAVIQVDPASGELLKIIAIPAQYVTSVIWGGQDFDVLYVTTSKFALNEKQKLQQPAAGSLFGITNLETRGFPSYFADVI